MKDLKIYYQTDDNDTSSIDPSFDFLVEKLAEQYGLEFQGSGVEIGKGVRDIHYRKEK